MLDAALIYTQWMPKRNIIQSHKIVPNPFLLAIVIALSVGLNGCNKEQAEDQQSETVAVDSEELLGDGFYGETEVDVKLGEETGEEIATVVDDAEQPETLTETNDSKQISSKEELVENFGFSTADEQAPSTVEENKQPSDCTTVNDAEELSSNSICKTISDRLASVSMSDCESAKLEPGLCNSVGQFPILVSEFAPIENRPPLGRILVIGGTHGDELTSVSIIFRWIKKLNKFHSGLFHWRIVPMLNPDGVLNREASRTNQNGVDLNRNMPSDDWDENALKYWTEKSGENERRYPGPHAASEPETQWLINEINTFKPAAIISVHAPYGVVDYDSLVLNAAPKSLGKLALNLLGTYPGSLGNYAGINKNIPVITVELPHAWDMPSHQESTKIWEDIVGWLRKNVTSENVAAQGY